MRARLAELAGITLLATVLAGMLAWPVLRAPDTRVFGVPLVGTHHDPFTMMQVWQQPVTTGVGFQPVTDLPGHWLAVTAGPVAAYNWMVLVTFPLTAVAAFALARQLKVARPGATLAALACAFSPFHLAHAAYHPHIAQVQWIPLYLMAFWYALGRLSGASLLWLILATAAVAGSNLYAGWTMAVLTPVVMLTTWWVQGRRQRWLSSASVLVFVGGCAMLTAAWVSPSWWVTRTSFAVSAAELPAYSARPIAYLMPPAAHPWLGAAVTQFWHGSGVTAGLLEQQVSLGWGILVLAAVATGVWVRRSSLNAAVAPLQVVPALLAIGAAAAILSASPALITGSGLHALAPMFRSYARFGVVTHLMAVLLAGIGLSVLWQRGRPARVFGVAAVVLVAAEYVVSPMAAYREVWPTAAHRWVHDHPTGLRVLDCVPYSPRTAADIWLTGGRLQLLGGSFSDCAEPHLPDKLAALGFTHLLIRASSDVAERYERAAARELLPGLARVQHDADASLWKVTAPLPAIYVDTMSGFLPREYDEARSWRWMEATSQWRIMNPGATALQASLKLELSAQTRSRGVLVRLNGTVVQHILVSPERQVYVLGPMLVPRGHHTLLFESADADPQSVAFFGWHWTTIQDVQ